MLLTQSTTMRYLFYSITDFHGLPGSGDGCLFIEDDELICRAFLKTLIYHQNQEIAGVRSACTLYEFYKDDQLYETDETLIGDIMSGSCGTRDSQLRVKI